MTIEDYCRVYGFSKRRLALGCGLTPGHVGDITNGRYPNGPGKTAIVMLHLGTQGMVTLEDLVPIEEYRERLNHKYLGRDGGPIGAEQT